MSQTSLWRDSYSLYQHKPSCIWDTSFKLIRLRHTDWFCILAVFKESALLKGQISCCWLQHPPHRQKPVVKSRKQEGQRCLCRSTARAFLRPVCSQKAVAQIANQNDLLLHIGRGRSSAIFFSLQLFFLHIIAFYNNASVGLYYFSHFDVIQIYKHCTVAPQSIWTLTPS